MSSTWTPPCFRRNMLLCKLTSVYTAMQKLDKIHFFLHYYLVGLQGYRLEVKKKKKKIYSLSISVLLILVLKVM